MPGPFLRLYLAAFLLDASVMVVFTITPFFVFNQLGGDASMAGTVGAIQMGAYAASCLVSARFVNQSRSGLPWALGGTCLFILLPCLMSLWPRFPVCCILALFSFSALGFVWPALHAWVGAEPDTSLRARRMAWFSIAAGFGFALSPLLGGPLYDVDERLPFAALAFLGVLTVFLIGSLPPERLYTRKKPERDDDGQPCRVAGAPRLERLVLAWSCVFAANILVGATRSVYAKHVIALLESGQLSLLPGGGPFTGYDEAPATVFSWMVSAMWLTTVFCFLFMGRTGRGHERMGLLISLQILGCFAAWTLGYARNLVMLVVCFSVLGADFAVAFFIAMFLSLADPEQKHGRAAITEGVLGAGGLVGSLAFGHCAGRFGVAAVFLYGSAVLGCTTCLALLFRCFLVREAGTKGTNRKPARDT